MAFCNQYQIQRTFLRLLLACWAGVAAAKTPVRIDVYPDYDNHLKLVMPPFAAANKDLEIRFTAFIFEEYHRRLAKKLAAGVGAGDVVLVDVSQLGAFINSGSLMDLSPYLAKTEKLEENFALYSLAQGKGSDGKQYAIPIDIGPGVLYYRRDLVDDLGFKIERIGRDWESFIEYGVQLKKKKGVALVATAADLADLIVYATVKDGEGLYFDKNGNSLLTSERFVQALSLAKKVRDLGLDANLVPWSKEWLEGLRTGKVATQLSGAWLLGHLKNSIAPDATGLWGAANLPNGIYGSWGGSFLAIPKQSKQAAAAWRVIEYLVQPRIQLQGLSHIGAFPANIITYRDPQFEAPVPYLKGQQAWQLFAGIARRVKAIQPHRNDPMAQEFYRGALNEVLAEGKDVKSSLDRAHQQLMVRARSAK